MSHEQMKSSLLALLQIVDSGFPTGSFSHSLGYESAVKHQHIKTMAQFKEFVITVLENIGSSYLPLLCKAYKKSEDVDEIIALDAYNEACLSNHIANRASVQQGKSLIATASETFSDERLLTLKKHIQSEKLKGHQAVMFGCLCSYLHISLEEALSAFLFSSLRTIIASSVRLGNMGPLEAQRTQFELQPCIPNIIERCIVVKQT
ncbi:urease accessory protein F-like, partial [Anneissia japonica]|uniref:urease accessory protein F-like n=1 Tax=Anneissia japonica TaxID=1529436 RepID=UPI001425AC7E